MVNKMQILSVNWSLAAAKSFAVLSKTTISAVILKKRISLPHLNNGQLKDLQETHALWESHGMHDREMLDKQGMQEHIKSDAYVGGVIDHSGGHIHPLNLALGEAAAIEQGGGTIYENTLVVDIEYADDAIKVITEFGSVTCKQGGFVR